VRCFVTMSKVATAAVVAAASAACASQDKVLAPVGAATHPTPASPSTSASSASAPPPHATLRIDTTTSFDVTLTYEDGLTFPVTVAEGQSEVDVPTGKMRWDRSWSGDCQYGPPGSPHELDAELRPGQTMHLRCAASMTLQNNMGLCCSPE
jgi:hypothetical protein